MMKKLACVAVVLMVANFANATVVTNNDLVLTVNYATGAATLKNAGTVAYQVYLYQIKSVASNLNPGTRASLDPITSVVTPSTPGAWQGICDDALMAPLATAAALGSGATSFQPFNNAQTALKSITEESFNSFVTFQPGQSWAIGNPVQPGKASLTDLSLKWNDFTQPGSLSYTGLVVITNVPEPATMCVLALGGVGALLRKRRQA